MGFGLGWNPLLCAMKMSPKRLTPYRIDWEKPLKYRREIDGLRAVAVLPVIFFHAGFEQFKGGFIGVDVFFVISGYLITTIILTDMNNQKFSILEFYERRARRILPALFFVMLCCLPFAWIWLLPTHIKDFSESLAAVSVFSSNFLFWRESGYFGVTSELKPLIHTWSLAVEEQYYLLFPLFLMMLGGFRKRWTLYSLLLIGAVSLAMAHWGAYEEPYATFFLLPTRGWELVIGALIAFYFLYMQDHAELIKTRKTISELFGIIGLLLITYSIITFDENTPFPSLYALIPTVGTGLIILFSTSETIVGRLLGLKPLVGMGLISYSTYLWHQSVFAFARHRFFPETGTNLLLLLSIVSILCGYLSWKFIENPFRNKNLFSRKRIFYLSFTFSIFFASLGLAGHFTDGFEKYWLKNEDNELVKTYNLIKSTRYGIDINGGQDNGICRFNITNLDPNIEKRIKTCYENFGPGLAVIGDSHAIDLYSIVIHRVDAPFIVGVAQGHCRPHTPNPKCHYERFRDFIAENKSIFSSVIYEQAGLFLLMKNSGQKGSRKMFTEIPYLDNVQGIKTDVDHVNSVVEYLNDLSNYTNVIWFGPRLEPHILESTILKHKCSYPFHLRKDQKKVFERLDNYILNSVKEKNFDFISQNKLFNFSFPEDFMTCEDKYWSDGDHFSSSGELRFSKRFDPTILYR